MSGRIIASRKATTSTVPSTRWRTVRTRLGRTCGGSSVMEPCTLSRGRALAHHRPAGAPAPRVTPALRFADTPQAALPLPVATFPMPRCALMPEAVGADNPAAHPASPDLSGMHGQRMLFPSVSFEPAAVERTTDVPTLYTVPARPPGPRRAVPAGPG